MNAAQAENSSDVILGNLSVNSIPAKVLFDSGASLCFMSRSFFAKNDFTWSYLDKPLGVFLRESQ